MPQKMISYTRQNRISAHSARRFLTGGNWLLIIAVVVLLVLLAAAILFMQASKAASDLKKMNEANVSELKSAVNSATKVIDGSDIQNQQGSSKAMAAITELSTTADRISNSCAEASKPIVVNMAKSYNEIIQNCEEITANARELRDSLNTFQPLARYQIELTNALAPTVAYHRGDDKLDFDKGIVAWSKTKDGLQKSSPPAALAANNTAMIDTISDIITNLEKAKAAKASNNNEEYKAALTIIESQYSNLRSQSQPIEEELTKAQKDLSKAARSIK